MSYTMFKVDDKLKKISDEALLLTQQQMYEISKVVDYNQEKVLKAFIECKVSESHFASSTGYGYNDRGREVLDLVYAKIFGAEDALVRHNFVSGTHALTVALFGILRPGDKALSITGEPYDTIKTVISDDVNKGTGTLKDFNIDFEYGNFIFNGIINYGDIEKKLLNNNYKVIYIQRSRGYTFRDSFSIEKIKSIVNLVRRVSKDSIIIVDNCYGEFVERLEPTEVDVDLIVGSLIKNPGGGIAKTGGYIIGKKKYVDLCSYRLTAPGIGKEVGATLNQNREMFMGIFNAPHVVGEALKTAVFTSAIFKLLGYNVCPEYDSYRTDIVQTVKLKTEENLIAFCKGIQMASPIDSFVTPEPWDMPGYNNKIIMAAGTFTLGSSIELTVDAPIKSPYGVWIQGGLNFSSAKISIIIAINNIINKN